MLNKLDRNTMLNSIEGRFHLPPTLKVIMKYRFNELLKGNKLKFILKNNYYKELGSKLLIEKNMV